MKKLSLILLVSIVFISCGEHNTPLSPDQPIADTTTYKNDTVNYLFCAAYTWDLHLLVTPHLFYVVNDQDTFMYDYSTSLDTLNDENCERVYNKIVESGMYPEAIGVKSCEFSRIVRYTIYKPFHITQFIAYTLKEPEKEGLFYVGGYDYDKAWRDGHKGSNQGLSSIGNGFQDITKDQLLEYLNNSESAVFTYKGVVYVRDSGTITTIYSE